jgi:hypothetical protein
MVYDFLITGTGEFSGDFDFTTSLQTTLSGEINVFGLQVGNGYDVSLARVTSISGQTFSWELPLSGSFFPEIGFNRLPVSALFVDYSGNFQEISANITGYRREQLPSAMAYDFLITASGELDYIAGFESSLPSSITNFGLKIGLPYDISQVEIIDVTDKTYEWSVPFQGSDIPEEGPNPVTFNAMFIDTCGNFQEISANVIAYKIPSLTAEREYYVQLKANINPEIYQNAFGDFGFNGAIINKEEESYDLCYNLPEGDVSMNIKTLDVVDICENVIGNIDLILELKTTKAGEIVPRVFFDGIPISTTIEDDIHTAEVSYFGTAVDSSVNADPSKADGLTSVLTPEKAEELFGQQIRALESLYRGSVLSAWRMEILKADAEPLSIINQVFEESGRTKSLPNFFNEGESITLAMGHSLELTVQDLNGNNVTVIPETMVYAVITQDSQAKRLNP